MHRIAITVTIVLALAIITLTTTSATLAADDASNDAPADAGAWNTTSTLRPDALLVQAIDDLARNTPDTELRVADARLVPVGFAREIAVVPTTNGARCIAAVEGLSIRLRLCGNRFPDSGASATHAVSPGAPPQLIGLVADDVTSVTIVLSDGSSHEVDPSPGAFWWTGDRGDEVVRLETERDGASHSETELFESARRA